MAHSREVSWRFGRMCLHFHPPLNWNCPWSFHLLVLYVEIHLLLEPLILLHDPRKRRTLAHFFQRKKSTRSGNRQLIFGMNQLPKWWSSWSKIQLRFTSPETYVMVSKEARAFESWKLYRIEWGTKTKSTPIAKLGKLCLCLCVIMKKVWEEKIQQNKEA